VCIKFNAKLGGTTYRAIGKTTSSPNGIFTIPTMIISADVLYATPSSNAPSIVALTMSTDKLTTRYAAAY
jgi:eukaryotic translation initiation factor 2C